MDSEKREEIMAEPQNLSEKEVNKELDEIKEMLSSAIRPFDLNIHATKILN